MRFSGTGKMCLASEPTLINSEALLEHAVSCRPRLLGYYQLFRWGCETLLPILVDQSIPADCRTSNMM